MKKNLMCRFYSLTMMSFLLLGIIIVTGCSSTNIVKSTPQDQNEKTIKTVLEKQFTGPDIKLIEMLSSEENVTVIGKDGEATQPPKNTELEKYYEKNYQPYFTERMYNNFIAAYAFNYQFLAHKSGYQIKVDNIDIKKIETTEGAYEFKVYVLYGKAGSKQKLAEVSGRVYFTKDGKITNIRYLDDGGFTKAMNN
ncbi:hypothetical protein ACFVRR_18805 [Gottfriedia sp. NPDC057948]|uniref:hypothetical protein n=1 Tax=Gottfriedia sp. NPDC057948 TaxID=3346287 RepID=UPI0036DEA8A3